MTARTGPGASRAAGFTLLEVLVALAILSLAIVVSIQAFAAGLRLLKVSGEHQEAMLIADQKAREVLTPTAGEREQGTEGMYAWERETKALAAPDLEIDGRATKWRAYEIDVRVRWGDHREVRLATLRTLAENPNVKPPAVKAP
ncbi:MAG TPA: prepilin-type N-terminal cleavage/methylation domain-containing protein [Methylomirabilota bacterium]|nr:prepilin-type N-terminal cleavage/methylation domain-containing protein [Methylomirabilota bacterium]